MEKAPLKEFTQEFHFPDFVIEHISEKIDLVIYQDKTQLLAGCSVIFSQGAETDHIPGIGYFTSQMLKRGTQTKTAMQIAEEIETLGTNLSCGMHWDFTPISVVSLTSHFKQSIEILFESIFNPAFNEDEIKRFKVKHIGDIAQDMADPSYLCNMNLNNKLYQNHPYGHPLIGTKESIKAITKDDCIKFHKQVLNSKKIYVIIAGNFPKSIISNYILKKIEQLDFPSKKIIIKNVKNVKSTNKIYIYNKSSIKQTILRIAKPSIGRTESDFPSLQFINTIFGGFFMSRLNELLREKLGYTYGIHSHIQTRKYGSAMMISTSIKQKATNDTVKKIFEEMNNLTTFTINDAEFKLARRYFLGSFIRSLETTNQVVSLIRTQLISELSNDYYQNFYQKIKTINQKELFEIQKKYMKPENLIISAVGRAEYIADSLKEFGEPIIIK